MGASIHRVIEEISANSAIVEQGIPFARRPITRDALALVFRPDQELEQLSFGLLNPVSERAIVVDLSKSDHLFMGSHYIGPLYRGVPLAGLMACIDSQ
jgi:hypothetical protein